MIFFPFIKHIFIDVSFVSGAGLEIKQRTDESFYSNEAFILGGLDNKEITKVI